MQLSPLRMQLSPLRMRRSGWHPPPSAGDHALAIPLDQSRTGMSTGSPLLSRSPSHNIRPMEPCAPCPITDRDPEGVASPVEDCHMVTHGPALLWSLLGPDRQLVATLCGTCPAVSTALCRSLWSQVRHARPLIGALGGA